MSSMDKTKFRIAVMGRLDRGSDLFQGSKFEPFFTCTICMDKMKTSRLVGKHHSTRVSATQFQV